MDKLPDASGADDHELEAVGDAVAPANQDMDCEPHQAIPKAGACSLVTRRAAVWGSTSLHNLALFKRLTESLPDLEEVLSR